MHAQAVQFLSFLWLAWPLASGALEESRLEVVDIQPCFVSRKVVSRSNSITYSLKANFSLCENFSDSSYALRVSTLSSEANGSFPLVFVTRQGKAVDSWTIPFRPPDFSIDFDRVNRTLCQQDTSADVDDVLAYIDVFTSFSENVTFSIVFEPVGNYTFRFTSLNSLMVLTQSLLKLRPAINAVLFSLSKMSLSVSTLCFFLCYWYMYMLVYHEPVYA
jgi:hypothetical protein